MSDLFNWGPDDVGDALARLNRRVGAVEQSIADPTLPMGALPTKFPDGISVGEDLHPLGQDVSVMEDLDVTTTIHLGIVDAQFEWTEVDNDENGYEVELVRWDDVLMVWVDPSYLRTGGTGVTATNLRTDTDYGARVWAINSIGLRGDPFPASGYVEFDTPLDDTIPAQPGAITIARGSTTVVVIVPEPADFDVVNGQGLIQVQIDTANTFSTGNLQGIKSGQVVVAFNTIISEAAWYARARYIDSSGNEGPWSVTAGPSTAGGVIDSMIVAGLNAAKITFGTMSGDRLTANTADIAILKTSSLITADITLNGGSLKAGSPPTTGLLLNSQGLRLYAAGVQTLILDAATGAATFRGNMAAGTITIGSRFSVDASGNLVATNVDLSGTINASGGTFSGTITATGTISGGNIVGATYKTAASGARIEIGVLGNAGFIDFYAPTGTRGTIFGGLMTAGSTSHGLRAFPPNWSSGDSYWEMWASKTCTFGPITRNSTDDVVIGGGTLQIIGFSNFTVSLAGAISGANLTTTGNVDCHGAYQLDGSTIITSSGDIQGIGQVVADSCDIDAMFTPGHGTTGSAANAFITASGGFQGLISRSTSRAEFKDNLVHIEDDTSVVLQLRPSRWNSRLHVFDLGGVDDPNADFYGLVVDEAALLHPAFIQEDEEGIPQNLNINGIVGFLIAEVAKLKEAFTSHLAEA